jgi:hypothetical protein
VDSHSGNHSGGLLNLGGNMKYKSGYDTYSHCWIVGIETDRGTIEKGLYFFGSSEEADLKVNELNGGQTI